MLVKLRASLSRLVIKEVVKLTWQQTFKRGSPTLRAQQAHETVAGPSIDDRITEDTLACCRHFATTGPRKDVVTLLTADPQLMDLVGQKPCQLVYMHLRHEARDWSFKRSTAFYWLQGISKCHLLILTNGVRTTQTIGGIYGLITVTKKDC